MVTLDKHNNILIDGKKVGVIILDGAVFVARLFTKKKVLKSFDLDEILERVSLV